MFSFTMLHSIMSIKCFKTIKNYVANTTSKLFYVFGSRRCRCSDRVLLITDGATVGYDQSIIIPEVAHTFSSVQFLMPLIILTHVFQVSSSEPCIRRTLAID
jgi:hypothetical protein